jgi:polysaccharide biosynthesis protein PslG
VNGRAAPLLGLLGALLLLLQLAPHWPAASAPAAPTPTPRPAQVQTANPKIGVHTRLTDEADPAKIARTMQMVRAMGAPWITEYFPWVYIQPTDAAHFDWSHADAVVAAAAAQGLTLIARFDGVPQWARPRDTTWKYLDPDHYADFAAFVGAFAARYRGRVGYYIIWNEPNLSAEWGARPPDPAAYTALLRAAYHAAKAADPACLVLLAGLAPTLEPPGSPWGLRDTAFLDGVYAAGGRNSFDGLAVHAYGLTAPPDDPPGPDKLNFARVTVMHDALVRHGDAAKPIFVTEGGWNDSPRWVLAVRPYQRIAYTIAAYEMARRDWPWCRAVTIWVFRYPKPAYTYFDNYTFVTPDFEPKPIYYEIQRYAHP